MPLIRKDKAPTQTPSSGSEDMHFGLTSENADQRWAAVRRLNRPESVQAVASLLSAETDVRVRQAAFTALSQIKSAAAVEAVLPYLRDERAEMRTAALDALKAMAEVATPHLAVLLRDEDPDIRILSCELARELPAEEGAALLCDLLDRETETNVAALAVEVLSEIGAAPSIAALERCKARFGQDAFLTFAIEAVIRRIGDAARSPNR